MSLVNKTACLRYARQLAKDRPGYTPRVARDLADFVESVVREALEFQVEHQSRRRLQTITNPWRGCSAEMIAKAQPRELRRRRRTA